MSYPEVVASAQLEQCLRESMRLSAPVPVFLRRVGDKPVRVGAVTLDPKVRVAIGVVPAHQDATHWPDPLAYRPARWTPEVVAQNPFGSDFFFPFGRGPRACHGAPVALFQLRSLLMALLGNPSRSFEFGAPQKLDAYFGSPMPMQMRGWVA
jgi:cytochrome P450